MDWQAVLARAQAEPVRQDRLVDGLRTVWPDVEVTAVEPLRGGLGSVLHRVTIRGAPVRTFVLRRLLTEFGDDGDTLRRELVAHEHLPALGLAVPVAYWADPDGDVLGRPAVALEDADGTVITPDLASPRGRQALAATIARLAAVPTGDVAGLPVLTDERAHANRFGPPATASRLVDAERLEQRRDALRGWFVPRRQLVHCDLHGGNVLWDGEDVTAVLDWPGAALGVAASDEAYAWLDTCLALGTDAGHALQGAVDDARSGPPPGAGEVALWRAVALRRALPTPAPWAASYRAAGIEVTDADVEERFVALVEDHTTRS